METFEEDKQKIHEMIGLPYTPVHRNARILDQHQSSRELAMMYFEDVSGEVKRNVERIYKLDLELFGYNPL